MKKFISFLYLLLIIKFAAFGQSDPQITHFTEFKMGFNPGFAGTEGNINGIVLNRYQWEGFKGAPKTLIFSANAAVNMFGSPGGLGVNFINDQIGFEKNTTININYSYKKALTFGNMGIGVSLGVFSKSINGEWLPPEIVDLDNRSSTPGDAGSDPLIPDGEVSQVVLDAGFGLYLKSNNYFLGASVTHINQASIVFEELESAYLVRHYYLMGGYNIKLSDPLFEVRPSFLLKSDLAGWQLDVNTSVVFDNRFWGGITYRVRDAVALLLGMEMENGLRFGYSFDLVTSAIANYGFASHEIYVSYSLDLERNRTQKYKSVRFL